MRTRLLILAIGGADDVWDFFLVKDVVEEFEVRLVFVCNAIHIWYGWWAPCSGEVSRRRRVRYTNSILYIKVCL